ncbi:MAG: ribulose-phosphate 3-epimerase [Anaerolineales bacterium]|nr:ribulose-phosphate 3-epimerase [Anaerolineales bacterium]
MANRRLLSTSVLSADLGCLAEEIRAVEEAGADWIHVDVMDGHFVPEISFGPVIVKACRAATSLPLDVHLMVEDPGIRIASYIDAGANWLSVQIEACVHINRVLQAIRELGAHPGIVLNPGTPAASLKEILHLVDLVLVMTVNPGYSGQSFLPHVAHKVAEIRSMLDEIDSSARLEVDGGIAPATVPIVIEAGADTFVAASAVFKHPQGPAAGTLELSEAIRGYKG